MEAELSPDRRTVTVFVPLAIRRRGGRKQVVSPEGGPAWAHGRWPASASPACRPGRAASRHRRTTFPTVETCQRPPRAERIPRAFSA